MIRVAYTRELNHHLDELARKFDEWRKNKVDCWELNNSIHQFHDGKSRDLYKIYNYTKDEVFLIARAIVHGFLKKDEVPKELVELTNKVASNLQVNETHKERMIKKGD